MNDRRGIERSLLLFDVAVVVCSVALTGPARQALAAWLPGLRPTVPPSQFAHLLLVFLPAWAIGAERVALNRVRTVAGPMVELLRALVWAQAGGITAIALILAAAQAPLNRSLIGVFLGISSTLLVLGKLAQRRAVARARGETLSLVVGGADGEGLDWVRERAVEPLASLDPAALRGRLHEGGVDEVVLPVSTDPAVLRPLVEACEEVGVPALLPLPMLDVGQVPPQAEVVGRDLYLTFTRQEADRPALVLKAIADRVLAAIGLVLCAPPLALVALLVKLDSRGHVLFVQSRGGRNGHPFPMFKFRTMRTGAEQERDSLLAANEMDGPVFKIREDPRVTRVGRVLRRTSMDELPQLVNVLLGHMSLVGPRPLPLVETRALAGPHRRRLSMKPGITGLWQVSGRSELGFDAWMALDLQYVDHWSLGLDLAILLRTLPALLFARGAH